LRCTLVANGTKRHFAALQQTVAFGGKADIKKRVSVGSAQMMRTVTFVTYRVTASVPCWLGFSGVVFLPSPATRAGRNGYCQRNSYAATKLGEQ
jgi:hypothetical protein